MNHRLNSTLNFQKPFKSSSERFALGRRSSHIQDNSSFDKYVMGSLKMFHSAFSDVFYWQSCEPTPRTFSLFFVVVSDPGLLLRGAVLTLVKPELNLSRVNNQGAQSLKPSLITFSTWDALILSYWNEYIKMKEMIRRIWDLTVDSIKEWFYQFKLFHEVFSSSIRLFFYLKSKTLINGFWIRPK